MTKEKILEATRELLKSEGAEGITTRKIAELAGTNIASVNYYFGSKDNLIQGIINEHLDSFRVSFDVLDEKELPPFERLKKFLMAYSSLLHNHPELAKMMLSKEHLAESYAEHIRFVKRQGMARLIDFICTLTESEDKAEAELIVSQMSAAILFPILIQAFVNPDLSKPAPKNAHAMETRIDWFLDHYFHKYDLAR